MKMSHKNYTWQDTLVIGHDEYSNPITVEQLVAALDGYETSLASSVMKIRKQNDENDALAKTVIELEKQLHSERSR